MPVHGTFKDHQNCTWGCVLEAGYKCEWLFVWPKLMAQLSHVTCWWSRRTKWNASKEHFNMLFCRFYWSFSALQCQKHTHTVHGRTSKQPPGIYKAPQIMGKTTNLNWLAGFLNHQPYLVGRYTPNLKKSNNPPLLQLGALSAACCPKRMKCSDW